jgi:hypothetical protein
VHFAERIVKSREMAGTGRTLILLWWLEGEGLKTTENKIHWPCWDCEESTVVNELKVVCNENQEGPGRWHTFGMGLGLWRSRFVCCLILLSSLISMYFRFRQVKHNL